MQGQGQQNQNMGQNQKTMTEKDILQDCLSSEKYTTTNYNTFAGECVSEQLRSAFLNILDDEHRIQADIFNEMSSKGWYAVQPADQQQLQQVKQKYGTQM
ncbi:MAG: spore coat protein [Oscillospiraceae bacterium]|nr:spore coat protein [Oscillospiraceae bacterium]